MSWWDDGAEVLGDGPADQITAAWRRVLVPRREAGLALPTVSQGLAAYAACLRVAPVAPALRRLVLHRDHAPDLAFTGLDEAPADLLASFDQAMSAIAAQYRDAFARLPTPMELGETLSFILRPSPADFFSDAPEVLGNSRWQLRADPAPGPAKRDLVFVLVGVSAAETERLITGLLGEGGRVIDRMSHPSAPMAAAAASACLAELDPDAESLTLHETTPVPPEAPSTIVHRRCRTPARLGIAQLRVLSRATGGWVLGIEIGVRSRIAAFHVGRLVELRDLSDEQSAWSALDSAYDAITRGSPDELRGLWCAEPRSLFVLAPSPLHERPLSPLRLAVIQAELSLVQRAAVMLGEVPLGLRLLERTSPMSGMAFTLLEGPFSDGWCEALARTLGCFVSAISLPGDGTEASFLELVPGKGATTGRCRGVAEIAEVWGRLTIASGDAPAVVSWPGEDAGLSLGEGSAEAPAR